MDPAAAGTGRVAAVPAVGAVGHPVPLRPDLSVAAAVARRVPMAVPVVWAAVAAAVQLSAEAAEAGMAWYTFMPCRSLRGCLPNLLQKSKVPPICPMR